jgi:hypothetical protein
MRFDVSRCIIHTKLEAYFSARAWMAMDWTGVAEGFLSLSHCVDDPTTGAFSAADRARLARLVSRESQRRAQSRASERRAEVGWEWAEIEELLLAEKVRLIDAVRSESMRRRTSLHHY